MCIVITLPYLQAYQYQYLTLKSVSNWLANKAKYKRAKSKKTDKREEFVISHDAQWARAIKPRIDVVEDIKGNLKVKEIKP